MTSSNSDDNLPVLADVDYGAIVMQLVTEVRRLAEITDGQNEILNEIKDQVGPVIEKMASNPMFKMMFGK